MRIGLSLKLSEPKYNVLAQNIQALFADGSQGWWYDDNDTTTLFQDSAGTTPVTAVEQFVGLQLDKSKGLVLGPELVTNGSFTTDSDWTKGAGWSIAGGVATLTANTGILSQTLSATNKWVKVSLETTLAYQLRIGGGSAGYYSGSKTLYFFSPGNLLEFVPNGSQTGTLDNISIRELPGNHRFQSTSGSRPVWSKRVNLCVNTEALNISFLTFSATLTDNQTTTPSGAPASRLVPNTVNTVHGAYFSSNFGAGTFVFSVEAKAAGYPRLGLRVYDGAAYRIYVTFDLITGTVVGSPTGTVTADNLGDGWWRVSVQSVASTGNMGAIAGWVIESLPSNVTVQQAFTGNGTSGMFVSKVDIRYANQATGLLPLYQRVNTSTDYDTNGFPGYLKADGVDDFLQTNSIGFTATDKITLCAGVRKLSDAAQAVVTELSATIASNNGTFLLAAPDGATNTYGWDSKGTTQVDAVASTFTAPITNVVTGIGNISGDSAIIRVNGVVADTETGDQGTGNYGNYPVYFFHRNSPAGTRFNGYEYGNIAVGKLLTADQLTALETYMNGLTKAY